MISLEPKHGTHGYLTGSFLGFATDVRHLSNRNLTKSQYLRYTDDSPCSRTSRYLLMFGPFTKHDPFVLLVRFIGHSKCNSRMQGILFVPCTPFAPLHTARIIVSVPYY
jgi:hypothetical protein